MSEHQYYEIFKLNNKKLYTIYKCSICQILKKIYIDDKLPLYYVGDPMFVDYSEPDCDETVIRSIIE